MEKGEQILGEIMRRQEKKMFMGERKEETKGKMRPYCMEERMRDHERSNSRP